MALIVTVYSWVGGRRPRLRLRHCYRPRRTLAISIGRDGGTVNVKASHLPENGPVREDQFRNVSNGPHYTASPSALYNLESIRNLENAALGGMILA
jgi:hypothetical protein